MIMYTWLCPGCLIPNYAAQHPRILLCERCVKSPEFDCGGYTLKIVLAPELAA